MSAIDKLNRFEINPVKMNLSRSRFNLSHSHKTTFNAGKLIPIMVKAVLPDDTWKIDVASVVRSITPAVPVMDNAFLDIFAFWVPNRISCVHPKDWEKICGENTAGYWAPSTESTLDNTGNTFTPVGSTSSYVVEANSLGNYIELPIGFRNPNIALSRLKYNGYFEIWNNWFRDENTQAPEDWKTWSSTDLFNYICKNESSISCKLKSVNKLHDYFTSCLPAPQKGASVMLPLGTSAPVIPGATDHYSAAASGYRAMRITTTYNMGSNTVAPLTVSNSLSSSSRLNDATMGGTSTGAGSYSWAPSNLYADLSAATAATINDIRQAFAIQKLLEKDARGGTRYKEMLMVHFGVSIPDNTVQIPEYLGGKRIPISMLQVTQTVADTNAPLGNVGAFSNTVDNSYICTKSFAEFGYIYVLACIRTMQSYSQGIDCDAWKTRRLDYYYPVMANLGEKAVKKIELFANSSSDLTTIFGYQEAWAEYRYIPNKISGYMASGSSDTIVPQFTYQNNFSAAPTLNSDFMVQPRSQIDNTLVVKTGNYQFIADFYFDIKAWRAMPYFSIPGLVDHH